jgi:hypothetical protein
MIVKIDHIALAAAYEEGRGLLEGLGYSLGAREEGMEIEPAKAGMLGGSHASHGLALFHSREGLGIELLSHVRGGGGPSYMLPICENAPEALFEATGDHVELEGRRLSLSTSRSAGASVLALRTGSGPARIRDIWLDMAFTDRSADFWACLGFKPAASAPDIPCLEFRSPLAPAACRLYFGGGRFASGEAPALDDPGFNCLAVVSSAPARERQALEARGFAPGTTSRVKVGGKALEVFFARGPSGELVEVVGLDR